MYICSARLLCIYWVYIETFQFWDIDYPQGQFFAFSTSLVSSCSCLVSLVSSCNIVVETPYLNVVIRSPPPGCIEPQNSPQKPWEATSGF